MPSEEAQRTGPIRAVALDVDGTLAGTDHRVSDRTARVVARVASLGVVPIIVTGRTERAARSLSDRLGLTSPFISCNGAVVTDARTGERLSLSTLDRGTVDAITALAFPRGLDVVVWTPESMIAARRSPSTELLERVNDESVAIGPVPSDAVVVKVMLGGEPLALDAVAAQVAVSAPVLKRGMTQFYESSSPGAGKREALRLVLGYLGIEDGACMGIADGETDAAWLRDVGLPVAVSNAMPGARQAAVQHIGHHADEAVADFLEEYFTLDEG